MSPCVSCAYPPIRIFWPRRSSAEKEIQEEREHHCEEDRGGQRQIKGKISPLNVDIPGQTAQPWDLSCQGQHGPEDNQNRPEDNQPFAEIAEGHELARPWGPG